MTKAYARYSFAAAVALAFAAAGCSNASDGDGNTESGIKVAQPDTQVFDYAPEGTAPQAKQEPDPELIAKGSTSLPYGNTFHAALTITNGQSVSFTTSNGSAGVDPVLVLFMECNNDAFFDSPYTERPCVRTLVVSDDYDYPAHGRHAQANWTNNLGYTVNAHLMGFAYNFSTGTADLTSYGTQSFVGGTLKLQGNAGTAWTSGSNGDPWLFTFNLFGGGTDGAYNDDTSTSPVNRESTITGATSLEMWYALSGFNAGTTTVNY